MEIIAVANQKGGVGKTDLCVNLSSSLAALFNKKVLLIDMDPQGNSTDYLINTKPELAISDIFLEGGKELKDVIQKTSIKNLDVIPADRSLAAIEVRIANDVDVQFKLKKKLKHLEGYDYVFIDTPPSLGFLTINTLAAADKVLIPVQVNYFAMDGVAKLMKTVEVVKEEINPYLDIYGFVLTMFDKRNNLSFEVEDAVRVAFKNKVFRTVIPINVRLAESPSHHKPIILHASYSSGSKAYTKLAKELIQNEKKAKR